MPQALHRPPTVQTYASLRLTAALTDHDVNFMINAEGGEVAGCGKPDGLGTRQRGVAAQLAVGRIVSSGPWTADEAVTRLFASHYRPLVRFAVLLLGDASRAEELVQDSFVALHSHWGQLRDPERAVAYLRQSVVNRARSAQRHRGVVDRSSVGRRRRPTRPAPSRTPWSRRPTPRSWRRCGGCRPASARPSSCGTTWTCPSCRRPTP